MKMIKAKKSATNGKKNYEFQSNLRMDENFKHTKVIQYVN